MRFQLLLPRHFRLAALAGPQDAAHTRDCPCLVFSASATVAACHRDRVLVVKISRRLTRFTGQFGKDLGMESGTFVDMPADRPHFDPPDKVATEIESTHCIDVASALLGFLSIRPPAFPELFYSLPMTFRGAAVQSPLSLPGRPWMPRGPRRRSRHSQLDAKCVSATCSCRWDQVLRIDLVLHVPLNVGPYRLCPP
ncbi:hypothetical protein AWB81_00242 [Caballeronia arationis]|nr:hypothetical protein AWB81_00242 [Caballeronia arationis]